MKSGNTDLEDAFVNVMFQEQRDGAPTVNKGSDTFYEQFVENGEPSLSTVATTSRQLIDEQPLANAAIQRFTGNLTNIRRPGLV